MLLVLDARTTASVQQQEWFSHWESESCCLCGEKCIKNVETSELH